ncbi:MAG: metallophosphoesterase [Clostridia bacterium]|nr:metallophosphoesterase [Clostridia bacterium]
MIKLIHFSDTHFCRPFDLISQEDFSVRCAELKNSFSHMMSYINENEINIALVAGDLFDAKTISSDTLSFIKNSLASCPHCRFFISPGDADPYGETSPYACVSWPPNVHIFKSAVPEQVHIDELNCDIYGVAVTSSTSFSEPTDTPEPFSVNRTNILVIHGETEKKRDPVYCFSEKDLRESDFDYIAMGHHHNISSSDFGHKYNYCGCFSGHGFEECGEKGALLVLIDNGNVSVKKLKFSSHSYLNISVDISEVSTYGNTDTAIARLIDEKLGEALEKRSKIESVSVCASLTGNISERLCYDIHAINKLVENSDKIIIKDNTVITPVSPLLSAMKAGITEEARVRGCEDLAERAMRIITSQLHAIRKER